MNAPTTIDTHLDPRDPTTIVEHPHFTDTTETSEQGHFTILTANRQATFLRHLQLFGNVRLACKVASVSAQTAYRARRRSAGFALAWDVALVAARSHAEATLADRAINGVEEAIYYHGEEIGRRKRYSDRLLLAHLARLDRMEERADIAAALPLLDAAIEALDEGADIEACFAVADEPGEGAENEPQDRVPCVPSCRTCGAESGEGEAADPTLPALERRLRAMEAARPAAAPALRDQALDYECSALCEEVCEEGADTPFVALVEAAQLAAFEAGEARWWEAYPAPGGRYRIGLVEEQAEAGADGDDGVLPRLARGDYDAASMQEGSERHGKGIGTGDGCGDHGCGDDGAYDRGRGAGAGQ